MWPRQLGETYADEWGCMQPPPRICILFPLLFRATWPRQSRGNKSVPMRVAACSPHAWAYFLYIRFWAMWPRTVGGKYANARGCTQPRALAYFFSLTCLGHMAQKSRGQACQCVWLHAAARIGILSPYSFWAMWPSQVGEKYANAWGCMQPHALA